VRDAAVLQPEDPLDVQRTQRVIPSPKALQVNCFLIVASRRSGRSPYHAPAEVGRVLVYYSEAALHKLALEARVSPIAQLRVDGVAANNASQTAVDIGAVTNAGQEGGAVARRDITYGAN
jgi:hypothetical protein